MDRCRPALRLALRSFVLAACYLLLSFLGRTHPPATSSSTAPASVPTTAAASVLGTAVERPGPASAPGTGLAAADPTTSPTTSAPAAGAAGATPAPVATTAAPVADPPAPEGASLRERVLAEIEFPWQERLPGWRIEFLPPREGFRGSTFPRRKVIEIYRRDDLTFDDYVHTTAHELGHAVDVTLLDDEDHELWNVVRGRDAGADWWVASGADDFASGAGDWAECFAWSQHPQGRWYSELGLPPTADELAAMAAIIG